MSSKIVFAALAACAAMLAAGPALAACEFKKIADLKVDTRRGAPMVEVGVNGKTALMLLNTSSQPKVVLGFDFMKSHRVQVSNSQGKMYISYNGGPIFSKPDAEAAQK